MTTNRNYAVPIKSTGGGLQASQQEGDPDGADTGTSSLIAHIPSDGPTEDTPVMALNLWRTSLITNSAGLLTPISEQIEEKWPYFPRFHRLLCTRPNIVPIAIATGVGPHGGSTVYYQGKAPPSAHQAGPHRIPDHLIDPALRAVDVNQHAPPQTPPTPPPSQRVPSGPPASASKATPNKVAQESLAIAMQKASATIKPVSKKRTFEDRFVDMTQYILPCLLL